MVLDERHREAGRRRERCRGGLEGDSQTVGCGELDQVIQAGASSGLLTSERSTRVRLGEDADVRRPELECQPHVTGRLARRRKRCFRVLGG